MKKLLITGGTGFVGSHLAEKAVKKGYKVIVFDRYNPNYNLGNLANSTLNKNIEFIFGDIRDYDSVVKAVSKVNYVFHLAALIGIPYSYVSPLAYIRTNVEGTYNVLEASRIKKIKQVIITSTSETYGSAQYVPMNENHPKVGQSPYSATKISADQLAISYFKSFKLPVKIARPFNTYGPRQSARAVIPTIISQILNKNKVSQEVVNLNQLVNKINLIFKNKTNSQNIEYKIKSLGNKILNLTLKEINYYIKINEN